VTAVARDPNDRSTVAKVATATALLGGVVKGLAVDRPRVAFALPNARANGKLGKWALELVSGKITSDIVPATGGTLRIGSHVLTNDAWKHSFRASTALSVGLVGVSMLYGIPNLIDGYQQGDGFGGMLDSRPGRTGVAASIAGAIELGIFGYALARSPGGAGRVVSALNHPIHMSGPIVLAGIALSAPILANELGFLDFMNKGDDRDWITAARDTVGDHGARIQRFLGMDD
jgi:hypothetical protein